MKLESVKWVVRGVNLVVDPGHGFLFSSVWYFCRGLYRPLFYYEYFQCGDPAQDVLNMGLRRERDIRQEGYEHEA